MHARRPTVCLVTALLLLLLGRNAYPQNTDQTCVHDVIYGYKQGVALTMDVFKPAKPNGIGVLWMVSGGWVSSHDALNPGLAQIFTSRGETVFEIVHSSAPKFTIPEILPDIRRAVRFIRTHAADYGVDPNRLGISGGSSGGHLSLITAAMGDDGSPNAADPIDRASSRLQAVACFFPPTDFLNYGKPGQQAIDIAMLKPFRPAFGVDGKTPDEVQKLAAELSPITHVTDRMPPTFIIHGDADPLVPLQQSQEFMDKLEMLKIPHKLDVRPKQGHGWAGMEKDIPLLAAWFEQYLGTSAK